MMKQTTFLFFFIVLTSCLKAQQISPRHEFRGVWIATVNNIDWPSRKGLSADEQKREFIRHLDMHQANGMNAVIMQIRPAADAFYPSTYEPWSEFLTGVQGKPPHPYYDPLEFMIEEVHKRGMEFHAWCNPYRAIVTLGKSSISPTHITRLHPEWFLNYGDKRYFDPGNKEAQNYVTRVVEDIVSRYDIDAIHFDDYFYPYRIPGKSFPDAASYRKYGNGLSLDDWRRSNVDSIIVQLSRAIRNINPQVRFGISPFGVWRNQEADPQGSATKAGQTNYDDLYADILLWLKMGWIDYVAPQLYWEFGHPAAAYETLLEWWSRNTYGKDCYIGLGIYKGGVNKAWRDVTLLPRQIEALRNTPNINGAIYFSSASFMKNPLGWNDSLRNNYYRYPALIAPGKNADGPPPPAPLVNGLSLKGNGTLSFTADLSEDTDQEIRLIGIYMNEDSEGGFETARLIQTKPFNGNNVVELQAPAGNYIQYYITLINRTNQESEPVPVISGL